MRKSGFVGMFALLVSTFFLFGFVQDQQIDRKQLREMLVQLGYGVKDTNTSLGKEAYSATFTRDGLNIPVNFQISASSSLIWLTVNLGPAPAETNATKVYALLNRNSKIQPCQFYVTDSKLLMMGLPIENRGVTNVTLRQRVDSILSHVVATKEVWQKA
jgi:hypothetical protein